MTASSRDAQPPQESAEGERVELSMGEKLSPVRYFTVDVGPLTMSTTVRAGESLTAAYSRLRAELAAAFEEERKLRLVEHLRSIREAASSTERERG